MKLNIIRRAFSLTELLIVLVVIAVLFAAMLPIMTSRKNKLALNSREPVWMFVADDDQKDAFFDSGVPQYSSAAYVGINPAIYKEKSPYAKVVLKATANGKKYQNMIQFRTGNSNNGEMSGILSLDDRGNLLNITTNYGKKEVNYNDVLADSDSIGNTVAGSGAFSFIHKATFNTSVGANSIAGVKNYHGGKPTSHVIAIGNNSGSSANASNSVLIGSDTGLSGITDNIIDETVGVGAGVLGTMYSAGKKNVFLGYNVVNAGNNTPSNTNNVILNSSFNNGDSNNSTIVGFGALAGGSPNTYNMTAVGADSCGLFGQIEGQTYVENVKGGRITCIGVQSANQNYGGTKDFGWETDPYEHIFLGSKNKYAPGRAVLEVHNIDKAFSSSFPGSKAKQLSPTVVLNSHLVVRGNTYFTSYQTGELMANATTTVFKDDGAEYGADDCRKKILLGRHKWRTGERWGALLEALTLVGFATFIISGIASAGAGWAIGSWAATAGAAIGSSLIDGSDDLRVSDPASGSVLFMKEGMACATSDEIYPNVNDSQVDKSLCPDLKLSDVRLKENIKVNNDSLTKLLLLEPYHYTYKADKNKTPQVGVMAQHLQKVLPNAVSKDKDGFLRIRWDEIFYVTINSVKDLDLKVEEASNNLDLIEKDIKVIKDDHKKVKNYIAEIDARIDKLEK